MKLIRKITFAFDKTYLCLFGFIYIAWDEFKKGYIFDFEGFYSSGYFHLFGIHVEFNPWNDKARKIMIVLFWILMFISGFIIGGTIE